MMPNPFEAFFADAPTALIVLGGTLLTTLLRCGARECGAALAAVAGLGRRHFDADKARSEMALQVQAITRDGLLRAHPRHFADAEMNAATDALFGQRSLPALLATHERWQAARVAWAQAAVSTLLQAADLAPVAGLAGTLISLSRLPANGVERSAYLVAIGMAVHATLYGLMAAHLLLVPLARAVERSAMREEGERQAIVDWLESLLGPVAGATPAITPADDARQRKPGPRAA
jgi:chemotaxis protein MotA